MQRDNERDLISAWQSGSLPAAQTFVRQRQAEARTIAYLLTLNRNQARGLAEAAFVRFFRSARSLDSEADTRQELLTRLGRIFLRKEYEAVEASSEAPLTGEIQQKYVVDNQRDRTLAALGRLDERERVALVLSEIAGFSPGELNRVLERSGTALVAPMETGRQRLRQTLDLPQGEPVRSILLDASFDGPREDLWADLEDDITRIHQEDQRRGQLITYGVVAGIVLVALISIVALFGNDLFNNDEDDALGAVGPTVTTDIIDDPNTPEPTAIPPTPTPEPEPLPLANVPDLLLRFQYTASEDTMMSTSLMQFSDDGSQLVPVEHAIAGTYGMNEYPIPMFSPDGRHLVMLRGDLSGESWPSEVAVYDSATGEQRWQGPVDAGRTSQSDMYTRSQRVLVTDDALYVVRLDDDGRSVLIDTYHLETGEPGDGAELPLAVDPDDSSFASLDLHLAPDSSRVLILAYSRWQDMSQSAADLFTIVSLPDLEIQRVERQSPGQSAPLMPTLGAALAVDGRTLYALNNESGLGQPTRVDFHDIDTGEHTAVMVPFENTQDFRHLTVAHSHDGYRMYLIDSYTGEVAIIHLTERRLERYFPIDPGNFADRFGPGEHRFVFAPTSTLSPDGERLYVSAGTFTTEQRFVYGIASGIWVIDLNTWTIADFWPVETSVEPILGEPDGTVLAQSWSRDDNPSMHILRIGRVNGEVVVNEIATHEPDGESNVMTMPLATLYQSQHGRTPAIDGNAPGTLAGYSTLPQVTASSQNHVVSDVSTTVTVRVYDPASGSVLRGPRDDVRFDPESTITALLTMEDQDDQLLVLNEAEPGVYRADAILPAEGVWDINVSIIAPDGNTRTIEKAGTIQVAPTLTGSDGDRYQFRVSFDPRSPTVGEEATFRIRLVNVESGAVVSEDVHFDVEQAVFDGGTIDALPDRISMSLANPATYFGSRSIVAGETSYGVWEGRITFQDAGQWTTAVRLQFAGLPLAEIPASRLTVHPAP